MTNHSNDFFDLSLYEMVQLDNQSVWQNKKMLPDDILWNIKFLLLLKSPKNPMNLKPMIYLLETIIANLSK